RPLSPNGLTGRCPMPNRSAHLLFFRIEGARAMTRTRALCCACGLLALSLLSAVGCNEKSAPSARLRVLAAASLADAFRDIGAAFEAANPGTVVEFSFGGSNQLRIQLENGGPGDVFASADRKQMDAAVSS